MGKGLRVNQFGSGTLIGIKLGKYKVGRLNLLMNLETAISFTYL